MARGLLALMFAIGILASGASSASAVIVRLSNGKLLSYESAPGSAASQTLTSFDEVFTNLEYNGGPVMSSNTNYALYWDPSGAPAYPSDYQPGIDTFFEDLAHDSGGHENTDSVSTQYNDAAGEFAQYDSHFGGALIDTDPYPANGCSEAAICLTDAQIQTELQSYVGAHNLPSDLTHEYFVLTPPGVESCFEASSAACSAGTPHAAYCSYHSNIPVGGGEIIYANDPYVAGTICDDGNHPNGTTSDATLSGGLSHEHNESITDPVPNETWTDWATGELTGYEIGDKCRTFVESSEFGTPLGIAPNGAKYNQVINGHLYWYQQEWSNQGRTCLQRFTFNGSEPTATFTVESHESEGTFDASGSNAPGGVARYDWQFNDPAGVSAPVETTTPVISHRFPEPGIYTVALTVFAADGTSIGTARAAAIGVTVSKVLPRKGGVLGGSSVTISGTNFTNATAVTFGSTPAASFTVSSPSKITAVSPPETAGIVDVRVTTPAGVSPINSSDRFRVAPVISSVMPNTGAEGGGTSVSVSGAGFAPGSEATSFKFGSARAKLVDCLWSSSCIVIAPPHEAGTVDVRATVNDVTSSKEAPADQFTYG